VLQVDLVPTVCALLGLPFPFSSLGGLVPGLAYAPCTPGSPACRCSADEQLHAHLQLLLRNADQVQRYLAAYQAAVAGKEGLLQPLPALPELTASHAAARAAALACLRPGAPSACHGPAVQHLSEYVAAALRTCRESWTEFHGVRMAWGCVALATGACLALGAQLLASSQTPWRGAGVRRRCSSRGHVPDVPWLLLVAVMAARLLALTSNSYMVREEDVLVFLSGTAAVVGAPHQPGARPPSLPPHHESRAPHGSAPHVVCRPWGWMGGGCVDAGAASRRLFAVRRWWL
jgi:hypothetical protein